MDAQIVAELTVTVGIGVTDTFATAVFVHPLVGRCPIKELIASLVNLLKGLVF